MDAIHEVKDLASNDTEGAYCQEADCLVMNTSKNSYKQVEGENNTEQREYSCCAWQGPASTSEHSEEMAMPADTFGRDGLMAPGFPF